MSLVNLLMERGEGVAAAMAGEGRAGLWSGTAGGGEARERGGAGTAAEGSWTWRRCSKRDTSLSNFMLHSVAAVKVSINRAAAQCCVWKSHNCSLTVLRILMTFSGSGSVPSIFLNPDPDLAPDPSI